MRRRCGLFSPGLGIVPSAVFVPDWLHALSLGVFQFFVTHLLRVLVGSDVFGVGGTADARWQTSCHTIRSMLFNWYEDEAREGRQHTKVQQLTPEMLGSGGKQIATWGSEANALLLFAMQHPLPAYVEVLPAGLRAHLVRGGDSAVGIYRICSELRGARTPPRKAQDRRQPSRK